MLTLERLSRALAGRYEIERELGHGGTSVVYLARDLRHQRFVAIKVLDPELATTVGADRFLLEIRTTAQLNHPHILPLHDSGETDGLLYYVIPYVEGPSLRERITEEATLPIEEALRITTEVAGGLVYAHAHGFIHRDIKPENILLGHAGHSYLADFGLARAVFGAGPGRLTSGRLAVGTPRYMSPEQAVGDADVGPPTDVYSLACVLFEMISGRPPFEATTVQAMLASHITATPPELRTFQPGASGEVEAIVRNALAKDPAVRLPARQFLAQLEQARRPPPRTVRRARWKERLRGPVGGVLVLAAAAVVLLVVRPRFQRGGGAAADTTRYVVFPIDSPTGTGGTDLASSLSDALREWRGIEIVDFRSVQDQLARRGAEPLDLETARDIALGLDAGRLVMGRLTAGSGRPVLGGTVYDATSDPIRALAHATQPLPAEAGGHEAAFRRLAYSLLFPGIRAIDGPIDRPGTDVVPALRAYAAGHAALRGWNLAAADSAFALAADRDPDFGQAQLWLAQVRGWASDDDIDRLQASGAVSHIDPSDHRHYRLAQALARLSERQFPQACAIYDSLVQEDEDDFVAWYGLGECLRRDDRVVADDASPTGYSFRASTQRALEAYEQAFSIRPEMMTMFSAGGYDRLRKLLLPGSALFRDGRTADGRVFLAYPALVGDTLAFVPFSPGEMAAGSPSLIPPTRAAAVRETQERFADLARLWVDRQPNSALASEALGVGLEMLGDPRALDMFQSARELAVDSIVATRIEAEEVWLLLRLSLPDDTLRLRRARAMTDTVLLETDSWPAGDRYELASLAALAGRAELTGRLMAADPSEEEERRAWGQDIVRESNRLLAYAAIGASRDSLEVIERRLRRLIRIQLPPADQARATQRLMTQAAGLALPVYRFEALAGLTDPLARLGYALATGDTAAAEDREFLRRAAVAAPANRALDATFVEAWLMLQQGDTSGAADHVDRRLEVLSTGVPAILRNPVQMATLIRSMCLRMEIATSQDETDALETWGRALRIVRGTPPDSAYAAACGG